MIRRALWLWLLLPAACGDPPPFQAAASFEPSSRTAADIDTIVIHTTEGGYDASKSFADNHARVYRGTINWFRDPESRVSAHYVIGHGGEVTQMVLEKDIAWHATYYNARSIGIECAGWAGRAETWTPELLDRLAALVAKLAHRYGVEVRHPSGDAVTAGGEFRGTGIIGHTQVQTPGARVVKERGLTTKTDPGPHFPWDRFIRMVRERAP